MKDHQAGKTGPQQPFLLQIGDRLPNVERLVVNEFHGGAGRDFRQFVQLRADAVRHFQSIGAFLSRDRQVGRFTTVDPHDGRLDGGAVGCGPDVADEDRRAVDDFDGNVVDLLHHADEAVGIHVVVQVADFDVAGRNDRALRIDRLDDVGR